MISTKYLGSLTELQCITRFYELGYPLSIPYGDSEKYDFILDVNGKLYRLQCKHANPHVDDNGEIDYISIKTVWQSGYTKNSSYQRHQYTSEDCDYFVTFWSGKCYLVPVDECSNEKRLRLRPPKNGQIKGINFLKDFVDEEVCKNL